MSPWEIIWDVLGWIVLAGIALFVSAFIIAAIMVPIQRARQRRNRTVKIMSSCDET